MKFLQQSAFRAHGARPSATRYIFNEIPRRPEEEIVLREREEALRMAALDRTVERVLNALPSRANPFRSLGTGPEGPFVVNESTGNLQAFIDAAGNNDSYRTVLRVADLPEGLTMEEVISALLGRTDNYNIAGLQGAVDPAPTQTEVEPEVLPIVDPLEGGPEELLETELPPNEGTLPIVDPLNPNAPEDFSVGIDLEAINSELDPEDQVSAIEFDAVTGNYLLIFENGDRVTINGAEITSQEDLVAAINDEIGVDTDPEPAPDAAPEATSTLSAVIAGFLEAQGLEAPVDSSANAGRGIRSVALAARREFVNTLPADIQEQIIPDGRFNGEASENLALVSFLNGEMVSTEPDTAIEADHYISLLDNLEDPSDVDAIIEAIRGNQVHTRLLQRDLTLLDFYNAGIDGVFGAGSRRGLEAALADERFDTLYDVERAARDAEVVAEGRSHGRNNPSVDALIAKILSGEEITEADVAFTGADQGGMADRTREILDFIEQAVANNEIDQSQASQIIELMMREEMYDPELPQAEVIARTLEDADGRFLPGLAAVNPRTRIREISPALVSRVNNDRAQLIEDMLASDEVHTFGPVNPDNPIVTIDGHEFDMRTLTKMYILTGGGQTAQGAGAVELPIGEMTTALNLHNLVYRDGALIGTMENGCQGNLVVIPVDRQYVPLPPAPPRRTPGTPAELMVPEQPDTPTRTPRYATRRCRWKCDGNDRVQECRVTFNDTGEVYQDWYEAQRYRNHPFCTPGDGDGDGDGGKGGSDGTGRSDERWKERITPIENALERVLQIKGVNYYWKPEHQAEMGDQLEIGVVAQDVEKVFPEAVVKNDEGVRAVKYDKLVGALVEAVRELKAEIDELKKNQ